MNDTALLRWKPPHLVPRQDAPVGRRLSSIDRALRAVPSIRIPVTPSNRSRLRELRRKELQLWSEVMPSREPKEPGFVRTPDPDREAQAILAVLGVAGLAVVFHATSVATAFATQWERIREFVTTLVQ